MRRRDWNDGDGQVDVIVSGIGQRSAVGRYAGTAQDPGDRVRLPPSFPDFEFTSLPADHVEVRIGNLLSRLPDESLAQARAFLVTELERTRTAEGINLGGANIMAIGTR